MKHAIAVFAIVTLTGAAFAQDQSQQQLQQDDAAMGMMTMRPGMEQSEADHGYMKAMRTMKQTMTQTEMSGDPSGDFVRMMVPHHQSAVDMVDVLLAQKDIDPEIRKMAEKMKADQTREIAEMKTWLENHGS